MKKMVTFGIILGLFFIAFGILWNVTKGSVSKNVSPSAQTPTIDVMPVVARALEKKIELPGEISAYQDVAIYPRVQGFVDWIGVDRGSQVKRGQLLAWLDAPELIAQQRGAQAKIGSAESRLTEAKAKLAAGESTYQKLKTASMTPGVVAGNDVVLAQKTVEAARAEVRSLQEEEKGARDAAQSVSDIASYLKITAPFDGMITERNVHTGSLVGTSGSLPMLRIQSLSRLRLTVAVPEKDLSGILSGEKVDFTVPAFPTQIFHGTIRRISHSLDVKTRTMPVELDVPNGSGKLAPGMYAEVRWPLKREHSSLFVPSSALVTTTERSFVVRIRNGMTEWVDVKQGEAAGDWIEVFGKLHAGDEVAVHGTDELRPGTQVTVQVQRKRGRRQ